LWRGAFVGPLLDVLLVMVSPLAANPRGARGEDQINAGTNMGFGLRDIDPVAKLLAIYVGNGVVTARHRRQAQSLCDESFTSVKQLREHIDNFVDAYNADAKPFVWSKSEVHQKRLKARFADQ
jgi:hypothetical protein